MRWCDLHMWRCRGADAVLAFVTPAAQTADFGGGVTRGTGEYLDPEAEEERFRCAAAPADISSCLLRQHQGCTGRAPAPPVAAAASVPLACAYLSVSSHCATVVASFAVLATFVDVSGVGWRGPQGGCGCLTAEPLTSLSGQ